MNRKIFIYLFLLVATGFLIVSLIFRFRQSSPFQKKRPLTSIKIKNKAIDIGKIPVADEAKAAFIIYNTGTNDLYIYKVEVSCNCTSGALTKESVAPGDSVAVTVKYNKKIEGYFFQDVLIYGNFKTSPEILSFEGYLID